MNLTIELSKACIFILIGAFLCKHFSKDTKVDQPNVVQIQKAECIAKITRTVSKDGSKVEVSEVVSNSDQLQSVITQEKKHNTISYIPKYDFGNYRTYHSFLYSYDNIGIYLSEDKQAGLVFSFSW